MAKFNTNWLRQKSDTVDLFKNGACEEGITLLSALGFDGRDVDAQEAYDTWKASDSVPDKWKRHADIFRTQIESLHHYMLKAHGSLDEIVELNEFRVYNGIEYKYSKTESTLRKHKAEMIDTIYNDMNDEIRIFILTSDNRQTRISLQTAKIYQGDETILLRNNNGEIVETTSSNFSNGYDEIIQKTKSKIEQDTVETSRVITDPSGFFKVWVKHTV
jgi:hypothetical protein